MVNLKATLKKSILPASVLAAFVIGYSANIINDNLYSSRASGPVSVGIVQETEKPKEDPLFNKIFPKTVPIEVASDPKAYQPRTYDLAVMPVDEKPSLSDLEKVLDSAKTDIQKEMDGKYRSSHSKMDLAVQKKSVEDVEIMLVSYNKTPFLQEADQGYKNFLVKVDTASKNLFESIPYLGAGIKRLEEAHIWMYKQVVKESDSFSLNFDNSIRAYKDLQSLESLAYSVLAADLNNYTSEIRFAQDPYQLRASFIEDSKTILAQMKSIVDLKFKLYGLPNNAKTEEQQKEFNQGYQEVLVQTSSIHDRLSSLYIESLKPQVKRSIEGSIYDIKPDEDQKKAQPSADLISRSFTAISDFGNSIKPQLWIDYIDKPIISTFDYLLGRSESKR